MTKITDGLLALGFNSGWVVSDGKIILWENAEAQPTKEIILEAAANYIKPEPTVADKLASVGLNLSDLKSALGLE